MLKKIELEPNQAIKLWFGGSVWFKPNYCRLLALLLIMIFKLTTIMIIDITIQFCSMECAIARVFVNSTLHANVRRTKKPTWIFTTSLN